MGKRFAMAFVPVILALLSIVGAKWYGFAPEIEPEFGQKLVTWGTCIVLVVLTFVSLFMNTGAPEKAKTE